MGGPGKTLLLIALSAAPVHAQSVTASLENVTRVESWSFFEPPPAAGNPRYTFPATRVRFGVSAEAERFALDGAFSYVRTENLPPDAIGPLALGSGGFYYAAAGVPYSYQLYLSELTFTLFTPDRRRALRVGRMHYGKKGTVPFSQDGPRKGDSPLFPRIEEVKRFRLDGRLIGAFDWSMYQRRFDGAHVTIGGEGWQVTGAAMMPTQGGYEESANLTMTRLQVGGGALALRPGVALPGSEVQAFAWVYRDRRAIQVRPDNTGFAAEAADVTVTAIGGSQVGSFGTRAGGIDTLVWAAGEIGDWYGQPHRAWSVAAEAGHRWSAAALKPWARAGVLVASGDRDPEDATHGTFFPMLPSGRTYALSAVYAGMNLRDLFAQVLLEGESRWRARVDLHRLDLASAGDRWYHGSGATARDGFFFGFSGRGSGGATSLGTILEGTLDVTLMKYLVDERLSRPHVGRRRRPRLVRRRSPVVLVCRERDRLLSVGLGGFAASWDSRFGARHESDARLRAAWRQLAALGEDLHLLQRRREHRRLGGDAAVAGGGIRQHRVVEEQRVDQFRCRGRHRPGLERAVVVVVGPPIPRRLCVGVPTARSSRPGSRWPRIEWRRARRPCPT